MFLVACSPFFPRLQVSASRCGPLRTLLPLQHRIGVEFGAIVAGRQQGIAAQCSDGVQFTGDTLTRDRVIGNGRQAFPAEVIDDAQDAEATSANQRVGKDVQRPALIGILRGRHRRPRTQGSLAAATLPPRQLFLAIEALELLPAHLRGAGHKVSEKGRDQTRNHEARTLASPQSRRLK